MKPSLPSVLLVLAGTALPSQLLYANDQRAFDLGVPIAYQNAPHADLSSKENVGSLPAATEIGPPLSDTRNARTGPFIVGDPTMRSRFEFQPHRSDRGPFVVSLDLPELVGGQVETSL